MRYHKSLKKAAGHIFTSIPESSQHQDFLGVIILVLLFGKISFISINLSQLFSLIGVNLTYEQSKVEDLFVNIEKLKHTVFALF